MKRDKSIIQEVTPLSGKDCFYIADRYKTEFTYPIHKHSEFELNLVLNAAGVKRIVGDSIEAIGDFDLVFIASENLEHVWEQNKCNSKNIREITIQFSPELFSEKLFEKKQFFSILHMFDLGQKGLSFSSQAIMKIYHLLDKLASGQDGFYAVMTFMTILYELSLFADEAKVLSSSSFAKIDMNADSTRMRKIQEYINENYKENITLGQLSEIAGLTPVSFSRFFKLHTGKSPFDYIIETRLGYAARLLVDSSKSVAEICFECGFNNISNFNRIFKKSKNCTPKEFRENYKKKKILI